MLGIVHHRAIDALRRALVHDRRRASDEGVEERFEARDRTDVEVARREEAHTIRSAMASVAIPGSLRGVRLVMVTDEPAGGSRVPTGEPIISVAPA